jgi:hypothetical protein
MATMTSFKNPSFQDRARQAAEAKEKALNQLRLRPDPDQETVALRKEAGARREVVQAKKAIAKKAAAEAAARAKGKARAKAAAPVPTEAERKAYARRPLRREAGSQIAAGLTAARFTLASSKSPC